MSDNFYGTTFGPSTPGAINLISGDTNGATPASIPGNVLNGTDIGDPDPTGDDCANGSMQMTGKNIGDQMNAAGVTWGWFQGGFRPTATDGTGKATCGATHQNIGGATIADYSAHHEPFQYYPSTENAHHLPPSSAAAIGTSDQANHQYDLTDFDTAVQSGNLPQVSFLKAAAFEDGHPGTSDPLDEQRFVARALDELEQSPQWSSTAVVITYDDSDGWYDHQAPTIVNHSNDPAVDGTICNGAAPDLGTATDRCGHGPRRPFIVVSPYSKVNDVDHTELDQTSIMKFIESNWGVAPIPAAQSSFDAVAGDMSGLFDFVAAPHDTPVYLDPTTGEVIASPPAGVVAAPPPQPTTTASVPVVPPPATTTQTTPIKPPPVVHKKATPKAKLSVTTKKSGKKLTVSLKVTGLSAKKGKITASVKLTLKGKRIATGKGTVKSQHLKLTLKAHKTLKKGTYKLSVTVTQAKKSTKFSKTVKLK
jgi:phospholipase C